MKRIVAAILMVCMVLALAACGSSNNTPAETKAAESQGNAEAQTQPAESAADAESEQESEEEAAPEVTSVQRGVLNVGLNQDVTNWCPFAFAGSATQIIYSICEPLGGFVDGEYVPVTMKSYTVSDDGMTFTGELYDYIKDSKGNEIKASDVVFAYEMGAGDQGTTVNFDRFVESFEATGDYTFEIKLTQSMPVGVLNKIAKMCVFSQKSYEESADGMVTMPIGSGPYEVTEHTSGYMFTVQKRADYWQTDESVMTPYNYANVDTINFYIIAESSQRTIAMEKGSIDTSSSIDSLDIDKFTSTGNYWTQPVYADAIFAMQPNCHEDTPCSDLNLRLAIFYAINNDAIAESVLGVNGFALHSIAPPQAELYTEDWEKQDNYLTQYDPAKAKEYLDKSNYKGETLTLLCQSADNHKNMAQIIIGFLEAVGIKVEMQALDSAVFREKLSDSTAWDLQINMCATNNTSIELINGEHSTLRSGTDRSKSFIKDDEYQELIKTCMVQQDFTRENIDKLFDYIIDHAYFYSIAGNCNYSVNPSWIAEPMVPALQGTGLCYGACTYTEE